MKRSAWALLALLSLFGASLAIEPAATLREEGTNQKQVVVDEQGLKLYPRFNKSLKPITELKKGQVLLIKRALKTWKQVQVKESGLTGWIYVEVKNTGEGFEKKYNLVAAPSVAGLVARGWSREYAGRHGADYSKVEELKKRLLDGEKFAKFLEGMGK